MVANSDKRKKISKVVIDRNACIGAATCVVLSPGVFELDDQGIASVLNGSETADDGELFIAAQSCPTQAIILLDDKGDKIFPK